MQLFLVENDRLDKETVSGKQKITFPLCKVLMYKPIFNLNQILSLFYKSHSFDLFFR